MSGKRLSRDYYVAKYWAHIEQDENGCWRWQGSLKSNGYASFYAGGGRGTNKTYAHRFAYELLIGPIPDGLDIDHLCRVRDCSNPGHLEAVTHRENMLRGDTFAAKHARKTHCHQGHPFDEVNTYWFLDGSGRGCRTCRNARSRKSA